MSMCKCKCSGYPEYGYALTATEATSEKKDMQQLNCMLASYIQRVRELKKASSVGGDFAMYHEAMKQLENELIKLQTMYEKELEKLRRKLDEAIRDRNRMAADGQKMADAQGKLTIEVKRVHQLEMDLHALEKALADKERENCELRARLAKCEEAAALSVKYCKENEDLKLRLSDSAKQRCDLEAKLKQLMDKLKFEGQVHDNQHRDMQDRVKAANEIIVALEAKMKSLNSLGDNLPAALHKLREGTVAEMKKFQMETECALNKNIAALKKQMDDDAKAKDHLARENRHLEEVIRGLKAKMAEYEAQAKALYAENQALRQEVDAERGRSAGSIQELQKKLKELQEHLMCHSKEFMFARDAQASLRAEIDTYKALLQEEGTKLSGCCGGSRVATPASKPKTPLNGMNLPTLSRSQTVQVTQTSRGYRPGGSCYDTTYKMDFTASRPNNKKYSFNWK